MLEVDIEQAACAAALLLGVTNAKMKAAGQRGYPDRIFLIPGGRPIFIEFKRPGDGELSKGQKVIIRRLRHYGYSVEVCDTVDEAVEHIKTAMGATFLPEQSR